ncbi:(Fe-S)-binding protein [Desertibacillus haloalkaliphilus]|nr:(Fe-S)-binding protein [Desertibacillus haloalkaliphilus]
MKTLHWRSPLLNFLIKQGKRLLRRSLENCFMKKISLLHYRRTLTNNYRLNKPHNNCTFIVIHYKIIIPDQQNCCGALHAHSGEKAAAKELAKKNLLAFEQAEVDYIISNAGGCGALLTEYEHLLADEPKWHERAKVFARKVKDITVDLAEVGLPKMKLPNQTVTYQDSCHLRNVMGTSIEPRQLLKNIEGVTFNEMNEADRCCGSTGAYNIIQPEMSMQILDHKMKHAQATNAQTIVTANPGCLLQMRAGIEREGLTDTARAVHIVDLLAEAVKEADKEQIL